MPEVFIIVLGRSLVNIYDQSRLLGTAVSALSSVFDFLDFLRLWSIH